MRAKYFSITLVFLLLLGALPADAVFRDRLRAFERINQENSPLQRTQAGSFLLSFGQTASPISKTVVLQNTGKRIPVEGIGFQNTSDRAFTFAGSAANCLGTLEDEESCSFAVTFTPNVARFGLEVSADIYLDAEGQRLNVVTLQAIHAATPKIVAETRQASGLILFRELPKRADGTSFLAWEAATEPTRKTVILKNTGTANLIISAVRLEPEPTSSFSLIGGPARCLGTFAPGVRCTEEIEFTPRGEAGLLISTSLVFETNVPNRREFSVELEGLAALPEAPSPAPPLSVILPIPPVAPAGTPVEVIESWSCRAFVICDEPASRKLRDRFRGYIMLGVERSGEAFYVHPVDGMAYYLGRPASAFAVMRKHGLGASNQTLSTLFESFSIPAPGAQATFRIRDRALGKRLAGKILLQVEAHGEAYYLDPITFEGYYLGRPADAFRIMRERGIGISNENLKAFELIPIE